MCLSHVDKKIKLHKHAYKVFDMYTDSKFQTPHYSNASIYELGKQYTDKATGRILASDASDYKKGFHYYRRLKDAKKSMNISSVIIKILVDDICATGIDTFGKAGVARTITLEKVAYKHKIKEPIMEGSSLRDKRILEQN